MTSIIGTDSVNLFGMIVLKGDLKLLSHGIKRRGYNARTLAKKLTGLKTNDIPTLIAAVEAKIEEQSKLPTINIQAY